MEEIQKLQQAQDAEKSPSPSPWYLVLTKPRMEELALAHLERQNFEGYAPRIQLEKIIRKKLQVVELPLFPRYLFIRPKDLAPVSLYPVRSTFGVSHLVTFGPEKTPGKIENVWIQRLQAEEARRSGSPLKECYHKGETVRILDGPFQGLLGVFDLREDQLRVRVLIDFLGKATRLPLPISAIEKI